MKIRGSVDAVSATSAEGWLFMPGRKSILVQAWLDGQIIGEAPAERHRPDLAEVGFGDGNCGFGIDFIREIAPDYQPAIAVKPADCDLEVPRTAKADPTALLAMLRRRYPAAGQTASIYGGLWTDRSDSRSLLAGRVTVGITPGDLAAPLTQFLQDGLILLPADPGTAAGTNGSYATLATAMLTTPVVLAILRQVLEDNPLVLYSELLDHADTTLYQPSTLRDTVSPTECLEVIIPLSPGVGLAVVPESPGLPEFFSGAESRWSTRLDTDTVLRALGTHALDDYEVPASTLAIIGPGTLHHLRLESEAKAVRLLVVPRRQEAPAAMKEIRRPQRVHSSGLAIMT